VKICSKCKIEKLEEEFYVRGGSRAGRQAYCKKCDSLNAKKWIKSWRLQNPDKAREKSRTWNEGVAIRLWRAQNPECIRVYRQKRRSATKEKLNRKITKAIYQSLRGNKNGRHWESIVDFTLDQLKSHLEKNFLPGMNWDNAGSWHIDHKIPITVFNFNIPEDIDFKRCWSLKNLQPLWAKENLVKSDKLSQPFQPALVMAIGGAVVQTRRKISQGCNQLTGEPGF
jgi:hypothetical protein